MSPKKWHLAAGKAMGNIGILALQGGFDAHSRAIRALGHAPVLVRTAHDFDGIDGLILPGGESTTQLKLMASQKLEEPLDEFVRYSGKPLFATCAGLILAAREVRDPEQRSFNWFDIVLSRNAWGRQVHSFESRSDLSDFPLVFIRAPRILEIGSEVTVLDTYNGEPIMIRQGNLVGATFHPELTSDLRVHKSVFGSGINQNSAKNAYL